MRPRRSRAGPSQGPSFPGNDYAWVRVAAGNTPRALVNRYPGTVPVAGSTEAAVGSSVCRSGSTTGWRCGTIQQKNASVTYPEGTITGLTRTNACAEPGDSGGSWLTGDQAQGVTSGGSGNCTSGGVIYFQPVNEILSAYNLTLTVSGGTPPTTPPTTPPPGGTTWQAGTTYATGAIVTYCRAAIPMQARAYSPDRLGTAERSRPLASAVKAPLIAGGRSDRFLTDTS